MSVNPYDHYPHAEAWVEDCEACLWEPPARIADQPPPVPNERPAVWELVIADMQERDQVGRQRYGTPLQAHNGRDALIDLYQELLDAVVYTRQLIEERTAVCPHRTFHRDGCPVLPPADPELIDVMQEGEQ